MAGRKKRVAVVQPDGIVQERRHRREIIAELRRIAKLGGGIIQALDVVAAARDESSVLHDQFDWDDEEAAEKWRLMQARRILRVHWRELKLGDATLTLQLYTSTHPVTGDSGYIETVKLGGPVVFALAVRDLEAWAKRYSGLLAMHGVLIPEDIVSVVGLRRRETA